MGSMTTNPTNPPQTPHQTIIDKNTFALPIQLEEGQPHTWTKITEKIGKSNKAAQDFLKMRSGRAEFTIKTFLAAINDQISPETAAIHRKHLEDLQGKVNNHINKKWFGKTAARKKMNALFKKAFDTLDQKTTTSHSGAPATSAPLDTPSPVILNQTPVSTSPPENPWNKTLKERLQSLLLSSTPLPQNKIAEEHMNAILYQELIVNQKRTDVTILPLIKNKLPEGKIELPDTTKYIVMTLDTENTTHNTSIVIDRKKNTYYYFDSHQQLIPQDFVRNLQMQGLLAQDAKETLCQTNIQTDGWSCGFHAIHNVITCLSSEPPKIDVGHQMQGAQLRNTYAQSFTTFVKENCSNDTDKPRSNKRNKMAIRDAIQTLLPESAQLIKIFKDELDEGKGGQTSLEDFVNQTLLQHSNTLSNDEKKILHEAKIGGTLGKLSSYSLLSEKQEEAREKTVLACIQKLLPTPSPGK